MSGTQRTKAPCATCGHLYTVGAGLTKHQNNCLDRQIRERSNQDALQRAYDEIDNRKKKLYELRRMTGVEGRLPAFRDEGSRSWENEDFTGLGMDTSEERDAGSLGMDYEGLLDSNDTGLPPNHIRTRYHPRTSLPDKIEDLDGPSAPKQQPETPSIESYAPFATLADFIFAERMVKMCASSEDINFILRNLHNGTLAKVTFQNAAQMRKTVDKASSIYEKFTEKKFTIPYTNSRGSTVDLQFSVWIKDGMQWLKDLVTDPLLRDHWDWHAKKKTLVLDGKECGEIITDPLTAEAAWDFESGLDKGTTDVALHLIAYSDKSNAARFNNMPIWPLCLRPASLPKSLANRNSAFAGNTMIALFPKMDPPAGENEDKNWPTTMRKVYHKALEIALEPFKEASKSGTWTYCGDGTLRRVFPSFLIINQDLLEQYLASLSRGNNALHGCPRCHVPRAQLYDLSGEWDLRSQDNMQAVVQKANQLLSEGRTGESEALLKSTGIYLVENAYWGISRCDVHDALSFDILHSIWLGIWGKHLWPLLRGCLSADGISELTYRLKTAPSFPNLLRVPALDTVEFSDGRKYFSILQQIIPFAVDLIPRNQYPLLQVIRILADITMIASFHMQLSSRIDWGEECVKKFGELIKTLCESGLYNADVFNFPKMHQLSHLFHDIRRKGTSDFLHCILGENFHQGLKLAYSTSNKRDATQQIVRNEERIELMSRIRFRIESFKSAFGTDESSQPDLEEDETEADNGLEEDPSIMDNRMPRYAMPRLPLIGIETKKGVDTLLIQQQRGYFSSALGIRCFEQFHRMVLAFINRTYEDIVQNDHGGQVNSRLGQTGSTDRHQGAYFPASLPIIPFRAIKHSFYSKDDGNECQELIRCNPLCFGSIRFDTVLIQTMDGLRPARLHLVFESSHHGLYWQLALVTYFTAYPASATDGIVGMRRYQEEMKGEIISLHSIVRSCYMSPVSLGPRNFYLNDLVAGDVDLYIRLNNIQ
ncbi:hypothetical protein FRC15_002829 [Serendipita sp. 397]|nr:hypothetical protein FRC15_002829 [Serendipita sp. 397]